MIERRAWVISLALSVLAGSLTAEAQERASVWDGAVHPAWWPLVFGLRWLMKVSAHRASDLALDILRQRYARGEITREEFEARKRDLS
jgi:hypothetical protein